MSPILVRPVREQLEHDRVIRLLQAKYKKKFDVAINPGSVQAAPVLIGSAPWYPDLVLTSSDRARRPAGTIEVETAESVNHLEAMSQWATFSRLKAPLHLYVPTASVDAAKRLCADLQIPVAEIWAFSSMGEQVRFALVHRGTKAVEPKGREAPVRAPRATKGRPVASKGSSVAKRGRPAASPSGSRKSAARARPAVRKRPVAPAAVRRKSAKSAGTSKARKRK